MKARHSAARGRSTSIRKKSEWLVLGRMAMTVITRDGKYILRLANNESKVRSTFFRGACGIRLTKNSRSKPRSTLILGETIPIVNVIDEVSDEPAMPRLCRIPATVYRTSSTWSATARPACLFFVLRDGTSGDTTYRPSRFRMLTSSLSMARPSHSTSTRPTTRPARSPNSPPALPPEQNIMKTRIEAGKRCGKRRKKVTAAAANISEQAVRAPTVHTSHRTRSSRSCRRHPETRASAGAPAVCVWRPTDFIDRVGVLLARYVLVRERHHAVFERTVEHQHAAAHVHRV